MTAQSCGNFATDLSVYDTEEHLVGRLEPGDMIIVTLCVCVCV